MPLAAHATIANGQLHLQAAWGDISQQAPLIQAQGQIAIATDLTHLTAAEALGLEVAQQLQAQGAR